MLLVEEDEMLTVLISALIVVAVAVVLMSPPATPPPNPVGPCSNEGTVPRSTEDPDYSGYFVVDTNWRIWIHCNKCGYDTYIRVSLDDFITNEDLRHPRLARMSGSAE